ncbi:potassium channel family protein [Krasilnikovia sp. M28-CT-15]|uniref:potassium channel family protein n=1 Tax=Krasilnikovia sp. M28-CT-15 TaxID=3373540 RepID=UPI003876305B
MGDGAGTDLRQRRTAPVIRALVRRRRRLTWLEALAAVATITVGVVLTGASVVIRTDPDRYPDFATALWWAITTVTTVGYGDVVPVSHAGRLAAVGLMFGGIGMFACLTAVAASMIVVSEVGEQERQIENEEHRIERIQDMILTRLTEIDAHLKSIEHLRQPSGQRRNSTTPKPTLGSRPLQLLGPRKWRDARPRSRRRSRQSYAGRTRPPKDQAG